MSNDIQLFMDVPEETSGQLNIDLTQSGAAGRLRKILAAIEGEEASVEALPGIKLLPIRDGEERIGALGTEDSSGSVAASSESGLLKKSSYKGAGVVMGHSYRYDPKAETMLPVKALKPKHPPKDMQKIATAPAPTSQALPPAEQVPQAILTEAPAPQAPVPAQVDPEKELALLKPAAPVIKECFQKDIVFETPIGDIPSKCSAVSIQTEKKIVIVTYIAGQVGFTPKKVGTEMVLRVDGSTLKIKHLGIQFAMEELDREVQLFALV